MHTSAQPLPQLLFIDDQESFQKFVTRNLGQIGYHVITVGHWHEAKSLIEKEKVQPEIVFVEPLSNGNFEDLKDICSQVSHTPIVVLSASRDPKTILKALRLGAQDYICKPFDLKELQRTIDEIIIRKRAKLEPAPLRAKAADDGFVFSSPKMKQIHDTVVQIANERIPLLLQGESGVGKEVIARLVHRCSKWSRRPFVKVNCAAVPAELAESELFGYEKGAFTGAYIDRPGKFEFANGGTIFLDEITEFTPATQAKLLQVLQDGKFTRLGSNQEIQVDVRVIAATNQKLDDAIEKGTFREDLYYRLNVVNIEIPPLRERKEDIPLLCDHFLSKFSEQNGNLKKIPEVLSKLFHAYQWRGNVRELENSIKRYLVMQDEEALRMELEAKISSQTLDDIIDKGKNEESLDLKEIAKKASAVAEKNMIIKTLAQTNWNKWRAAKELKVSYKTFLTKVVEYDIKPQTGKVLTQS
ncbi:MAG TPA: sigma-54 dependent transcriptional regulator [Acidobacteriota bacterium]|jgi:two-component system response regulator AtoC